MLFIVLLYVAFIVAYGAFAFIHLQRFDHDSLPHASDDLCAELLKSLRETPEQWTGVSGNPFIRDFEYWITNESGMRLWIANGSGFLKVWEPSKQYIPVRWKLPMWRAFKKNKHRMRTSNAA